MIAESIPPESGRSTAARGQSDPFAYGHHAYRQKGWLGTIPLPAGQKHPPPAGWTGRAARHPHQEDVEQWLSKSKFKRANIALHLGETPDGQYEVIGIDTDDYGDKCGGRQLKELEAQYGQLPPTCISTARALPSGIRFYRVPKGYAFIGKAASAIEIIQRAHRYAVVWPSWNPDADAGYVWLDADGAELHGLDALPSVDELPILSPDDPVTAGWFDFLTRGGTTDEGVPVDMESSASEIEDWANDTLPGDRDTLPCAGMQARVDHWVRLIGAEESSHDKITGAHWNLLCLAKEGHHGWQAARSAVEKVYVETTLTRGKRSVGELRGEITRSLVKAARKLKAAIDAGSDGAAPPCLCDDEEAQRLITSAFAPGGFWHPDTAKPWEAAVSGGDGGPSWAAIDLRAALRDAATVVPRMLIRSDGVALLYPGKVHSVHGESESGKSWLVQCATAERLLAGEPVLYLDFEDDAASVARRLLLLGVPEDLVLSPELFCYLNPEINPAKGSAAERRAFTHTINSTYSLAVIDGVTESMTLYGLSGKDADDVATWHQQLPKVIARNTGAAVVCIDHVTKDPTTRSRWAQGSQHKMSALDGAAYVVEAESPLAVGQAGRLSVRVAKDRPGRVRALAGRWRKSDRTQHVADLHLDSTDPARSHWRLEVPEDAGQPTEVDEGAAAASDKPRKILTWFMEQLSRQLEALMQAEQQAADDAAAAKVRALRTRNKIAEAMEASSEERGKGKQRDYWRAALKVLVDEGYVQITEGQRRSNIHNLTKPYRQADDPLSDQYCGVSQDAVRNFRVRGGGTPNDEKTGAES